MESLPEGSQLTLQDAELQVTVMRVFVPTPVPNRSGWFGREGAVGYPSLFSPVSSQRGSLLFRNLLDFFFFCFLISQPQSPENEEPIPSKS